MARRSLQRTSSRPSAARLVREQGYSVQKAAQSLGVDPGSIRDWVRKFAPARRPRLPAPPPPSCASELERLRAENKRLLMEREILKKATAFFAREQP